jgi:hypothetical protein
MSSLRQTKRISGDNSVSVKPSSLCEVTTMSNPQYNGVSVKPSSLCAATPRRLRVSPPKLRLTPSEHFAKQLSDRRFDLSILAPVYTAMINAPIGTEQEFSIGRSSVIAVKASECEAVLKTGWKGDRTKR